MIPQKFLNYRVSPFIKKYVLRHLLTPGMIELTVVKLDSNKCLDRVVCDYSDSKSTMNINDEEKDVISM